MIPAGKRLRIGVHLEHMPLPTDEGLIALSEELLEQLDSIFGLHPGFRPAHAKGAMLTGTFAPSPGADYITRAPHIQRESTPVTVRFSNSTGLPLIPDNDPNANPRGIAIRFHLAEHVHTDIIGHSTDGFPTRTGEEFLGSCALSLRAIPQSRRPLRSRFTSAPIQRHWHSCRHRSPPPPASPGSHISASQRCASRTRMASPTLGATELCRKPETITCQMPPQPLAGGASCLTNLWKEFRVAQLHSVSLCKSLTARTSWMTQLSIGPRTAV